MKHHYDDYIEDDYPSEYETQDDEDDYRESEEYENLLRKYSIMASRMKQHVSFFGIPITIPNPDDWIDFIQQFE